MHYFIRCSMILTSAVFIFCTLLLSPVRATSSNTDTVTNGATKTYTFPDERIWKFNSHIEVQKNSTLKVTETITVHSESMDIQHGIYRDFPTIYPLAKIFRSTVGFHVEQVLRNGEPENYWLESLKNGKRVYNGNKDTLLEPGQYTYTIVYTTTRQLAFLTNYDQLYWNVTGNGWSFPIDETTATVILPEGTKNNIIKTDGFTGLQGATDKYFTSSVDHNGTITFTTTQPLN